MARRRHESVTIDVESVPVAKAVDAADAEQEPTTDAETVIEAEPATDGDAAALAVLDEALKTDGEKEGESAPFEPPPPRRPRKYTRRAKSGPQPPPEPVNVAAQLVDPLKMAFSVGTKMLVNARGSMYAVNDEELSMLAETWAAALGPYMGQATKYVPVLLAVGVTYGIFMPRIEADLARQSQGGESGSAEITAE